MKKYWPVLLLLFVGLGLSVAGSESQATVERVYSRGLYPHIARALTLLTGWIPFSLAEVVGILLIGGIIAGVITSAFDHDWRTIGRILLRLLGGAATLYFLFIVLWGLNYSRMPFAQAAGLDTTNPTKTELVAVCNWLITETNTLRLQITENTAGSMLLPLGVHDALKRTQLGYNHAAGYYPTLAGRYSTPKGVQASKLMSYQGIGGIYMPFTGEANVNILMPHSAIPFTAAHEAAHQHGYSREDEANFIAYLTCSLHPDKDFRYSGTMQAMLYAMRALNGQDPEVHAALNASISIAVKRDIQAERDFWKAHEGIIERISNRMNDAYLKANRQEDGVASYGRMVDLLIAQYREHGQLVSP